MTKWHVHAAIHGGKYVGEVEADSAEEAFEKAADLDCGVSLCWSCDRQLSDPEVSYLIVENDDGTECVTDDDDPHRLINTMKARIAELEAKLEQK